jgi:hypothetical protein
MNKIEEIINEKEIKEFSFKDYTQEELKNLILDLNAWDKKQTEITKTPEYLFNEFQIIARHKIIGEKLKTILLLRLEEMLATINDVTKRIDDFHQKRDDLIKEFGETEADKMIQKQYTNQELYDQSNLKQVLPNMFMEVETLVAAINQNLLLIDKSKTSDIVFYLNTELNLLIE